MRPRLPFLISQPICVPNWKFSRRSSIDHERFASMYTPSRTSSKRFSNGTVPGSKFRLHMRIIGTCSQLSARTHDVDVAPI